MKYCTTCGQNVNPTKKFSFAWFLLNCLWIIGAGVYIIYWIALKKRTCSVCHGHQFERKREAIDLKDDRPIESVLSKTNQWANSKDVHKQKLSMRQKLLQQGLKSAERSQELKDVAEFQVKCEVATAATTLAIKQKKLEKKQKRAARMRVYHLSEETMEPGI